MNITEPFVLKDDVRLIPCADLSDDVRARIAFEEGDFTLSRRHGRSFAQVVDGETAALLSLFRQPCTIVDAIVENSRSFGKDPQAALLELVPHLEKFLDHRILVPADAEEEPESRPRYDAGAIVAGWEIVRCASLIEDSEVYQIRKGNGVAALKIARMAHVRPLFDNEAFILRHLDGSGVAPRLIDCGDHEERPYLITEWAAGVEPGVAAAQRRHDRSALIEICASIAEAYAALHAHGVLHSDVHVRNLMVGDKITLLDFGYSRLVDQPSRVGRGGVSYFFEPEYVVAMREGTACASSERGEQYAVAAMLYFFIAGDHSIDFSFERDEMWRQIETEPPLPFARRGIPPWPEVERILFRALEKDPAQRFASMAEMAALLGEVRQAAARQSLAMPLSEESNELLETTLRSLSRGGAMFGTGYAAAPRASINYGCAGAAIGLLRVAEARSDPALLALADVWRSRAEALVDAEDAFYNLERDMTPEHLGEISPYHTAAGVHAAAAMLAAANCRYAGDAIDAFLRASRKPCSELDVTLGRSSSLLAAAILLPLVDDAPQAEALRAFGAETMQAIWSELREHPSLDGYLGMAHGWAGYTYAAMRWCAAAGDAVPSFVVDRLLDLAALKILHGRGAYWPGSIDRTSNGLTSSWCHGTTGYVFLFTLAHRLLGDDAWLQLAELAAWHTWDDARNNETLCCGTAGRAYALLNLYKHTGATEWLSRARQLANHAAATAKATAQWTYALWKGELGAAVLIADLAAPENARMPFFE